MKTLLIILFFAHAAIDTMRVEYYGRVWNNYCGITYLKGQPARAFNKFIEK